MNEFLAAISMDSALTGEQDGASQWALLMPRGEFKWKDGKVLKHDDAAMAQFEANFRAKVLHIDLSGNTEHNPGEAVGWVRDVRQTPAGLEGLIEWTPVGLKAKAEKLFAYISPEWFRTYTDPQTGRKHSNVLAGFALTNDPFFRQPMAEHSVLAASGGVRFAYVNAASTTEHTEDDEEDTTMPRPRKAAVKPDPEELDDVEDIEEGEEAEGTASGLATRPTKATATADGDGERLRAENRELAGRLKAVEEREAATRRELDRKGILEAMAAPIKVAGRDHVIAPKLRERVANLALGMDADEKLFAAADGTANGRSERDELLAIARDMAASVVELGERGFAGAPPEADPQVALDLEVEKLIASAGVKDDGTPKLSYEAALNAVTATRPDLVEAVDAEQKQKGK